MLLTKAFILALILAASCSCADARLHASLLGSLAMLLAAEPKLRWLPLRARPWGVGAAVLGVGGGLQRFGAGWPPYTEGPDRSALVGTNLTVVPQNSSASAGGLGSLVTVMRCE